MLYLDNSSTTKTSSEVVDTMNQIMERYWGNPSSLHNMGVASEKILKKSREILANSLKASPEEIIFTSGGTESNNLFIKGIIKKYQGRGKHLISTKIEHPAVLDIIKGFADSGFRVTWLDVDERGLISLDDLKDSLCEDTILTTIMHVNNETGAVQPILKAGQIIKENSKSFFFVDGVQGYLKVPLDLQAAQVDGYSISAHKIHGPKGNGALYIRKKLIIFPLFDGGGQERGLRSGTENLPGIAGLAKSVQLLEPGYLKLHKENMVKKDNFIKMLRDYIPEVKINSPIIDPELSSPYVINISLPGVRGETILHALENDEIYVSTGSACSGKDKAFSHVLTAMGLPEKFLMGSIRISLSLMEWPDENKMEYFVKKLKNAYDRLK